MAFAGLGRAGVAGMTVGIVDDFERDRREGLPQLFRDLLFNAHSAASTLTAHLSAFAGTRAILVVTSAASHNADSMKLDSKFFDRLRVKPDENRLLRDSCPNCD